MSLFEDWGRQMVKPEEMWQCQTMNCGYIYNPDKGDRKGKIPKGTLFEDLPEDWRCPVCGASKKAFRPLAGLGSVAENMRYKRRPYLPLGAFLMIFSSPAHRL